MIRLRGLQKQDANRMLEWMHDPEIQKNFQKDFLDKEMPDILYFIETASCCPKEGGSVHFAVAGDEDEYLGTISLKNICLGERCAEYAVSLRKCAQGKGIGYEATKKLLQMAFGTFGLERVYLKVMADNEKAVRLYEKCGFVPDADFREQIYRNGKSCELKGYAIFREDFFAGKER